MNVLVTGGAGLIGMAVRKVLRDAGHAVVAVDQSSHGRDDPALLLMSLNDLAGMNELATRHRFEGIVHCGAISGPMMARGQPLEIVRTNIDGTANILELARLGGGIRMVFCSSISVYGDVGEALMTEDLTPHPTSVYGATKVAGEQLIAAYAAEFGIDGVSLRIGRVYGPYRRANCLIQDMIEAAVAGREIPVPCEAGFVYHYVWSGDVAAAILTALTAPRLPSGVYNVGSGEAATMPEIVAIARGVLPGLSARIVPGQDEVPDVQKSFDVRRMADELGFRARFDLTRGIAAYADARHPGWRDGARVRAVFTAG